MKKLLSLALACVLLLGLGVPALAAAPDPIKGWDHVTQVLALEDYIHGEHMPITVALRADGTVLKDGPERGSPGGAEAVLAGVSGRRLRADHRPL